MQAAVNAITEATTRIGLKRMTRVLNGNLDGMRNGIAGGNGIVALLHISSSQKHM